MMKKANEMSVAAYMMLTNFVNDLKNDERGLSGVVVAVLLILIAVLAVAFIWGGLGTYLRDTWNRIIGVDFNEL